MKRVLGSTMGHRDYAKSIESGIFGPEEYEYFCKLCHVGRMSEFTINELKNMFYGFELAYNYCKENQVEFPELLVFVNPTASKPLCKISLAESVHIEYSFGTETYENYTWDELLLTLDETIDLLARILDV